MFRLSLPKKFPYVSLVFMAFIVNSWCFMNDSPFLPKRGTMGGGWGVDPLLIPQTAEAQNPAKQFSSYHWYDWYDEYPMNYNGFNIRADSILAVSYPNLSKFESLSNPPPKKNAQKNIPLQHRELGTATCSPAFTIKARRRAWTSCANFQCVVFALLSVMEKWDLCRVILDNWVLIWW